MTQNTFASWLDAYRRAWTSRDPQAAADLFTEHGTYQVTPFVEPMRGRQAILDYWTHVTQTEQDIQFRYEILSVTPEQGIARWWASLLLFRPAFKPNSTASFSSLLTKMAGAIHSASGGTNYKIESALRCRLATKRKPHRHE